MRKPTILLLAMACLLAAGFGVSIYASQELFDTFSMEVGTVEVGFPMEITAEIEQGRGLYAIEIIDYQDGMSVNARVLGPLGVTVTSAVIERDPYEETFVVDETYQYTLLIEADSEPISVTGIIGPEPNASQMSLGFVSLYMLLVGVVGMIASVVYMVWQRRRLNSGNYPFR